MSESKVYSIGPTWKGFSAIRRLVIFGDSYSSLEDAYSGARPDATLPLGVSFPGFTWSEPGSPNWLGHLVRKYCPEPRFPAVADTDTAQQAAWAENPLLVHAYAKGGDTVDGVQIQVQRLFLPTLGQKPVWAPWTPAETLFITWVGINDCAYTQPQDAIDKLFVLQSELYKAGARNFLFVDVPTIHRSPAVPRNRQDRVKSICELWNINLHQETKEFCSTNEDVTAFVFSSFETFDTMLGNLEQLGMKPEDAQRSGGDVWIDHIHPSSKVHDHIACKMAEFLGRIPPKSS